MPLSLCRLQLHGDEHHRETCDTHGSEPAQHVQQQGKKTMNWSSNPGYEKDDSLEDEKTHSREERSLA